MFCYRDIVNHAFTILDGLELCMNFNLENFSRHGRVRLQQRSIPPGIVDLIVQYGEESRAGEGASTYFLSKHSCRKIKKWFGAAVADAISPYRRVYVVASGDTVITTAFARRPRHD